MCPLVPTLEWIKMALRLREVLLNHRMGSKKGLVFMFRRLRSETGLFGHCLTLLSRWVLVLV